MQKFIFFIFICVLFCGCDFAEQKFILVNKTSRTLTIFKPRELPISNASLYRAFKPKEGVNGYHISFSWIAKPYTKKENFSMYSFASQFNTSDGRLRLIVLDLDSLKLMAQNQILDSISIGRAILKHISISKDELEKNKKVIVYED